MLEGHELEGQEEEEEDEKEQTEEKLFSYDIYIKRFNRVLLLVTSSNKCLTSGNKKLIVFVLLCFCALHSSR